MLSLGLNDLFTNPPRGFAPTPLWWWSGGRVSAERIRWQMERFAEGGIYNLVVINLAPAGPLYGAPADDPAWFSDEWWARFVDTCEIAAELDMTIWFYDQIGFSGANVQGMITHDHPEAAGRGLRRRPAVADQARQVELEVGEELVAAFAEDGARLGSFADGTVQTSPGTGLRIVVSAPTAFDYLNPAAVDLLIDTIHRQYEQRVPQYLGTVIAGSFQDELPATNVWTYRFADEFRARMGYELLDHLEALFDNLPATTDDTHAAKVRGDYYGVRAQLTEEALFRPLAEWHQHHGLLLGSDQSNPARAGNPTQATQLYTDYFRTHRWYSAAGSDHEGDAKVHSSMAHLYGHDRVWIESFHSSGWGGTLEDTYDWLLPFLRSGANLYNPHASYFDTSAGWFEWAPPSTDWRQPYWRHYPAFSRAVARLSSILSWGRYSADAAVLYPSATAQALLPLDIGVNHFGDGTVGAGHELLDQTQEHYLDLAGANNWFTTCPGALDSAGIAFDIIDDDSVQRAEIGDGRMAVAGQTYSTVLLPSASVVEEATAHQLTSLLDHGGTVIILGRPPSMTAGLRSDDSAAHRLAEHPNVITVTATAAAVAAVGRRDYATSDVPLLVRRDGADAVALVSGAFPNASAYPLRTGTWLWSDYDFDNTRYAQQRVVTVAGHVAEAEVWDPATDRRAPAPITVHDDTSTIDVRLDGAPAVLLVWREANQPADTAGPHLVSPPDEPAPDEPAPHPTVVELRSGWTGELLPTLDNTWGDFASPAASDVSALQLWSLDWAETDPDTSGPPTDWVPARVTFGQRIRISPPARVAPAPLTPEEVNDVLAGRRPLADPTWDPYIYSTSRGLEKNSGTLGNKGRVPTEFVQIPSPQPQETVSVRTIIWTDRLGAADLVVAAPVAKRLWWNGQEQPLTDDYSSILPVDVNAEFSVLEYQLGATEQHSAMSLDNAPTVGSFFTLVRTGGFDHRPEMMRVGDQVRPNGRVSYWHSLTMPADAQRAVLVVGAATGLTVLLDGQPVARQEHVEYYESDWGATPMYFRHDIADRLPAGEHHLEILADSADSRDIVFVDLVAHHVHGISSLVSGPGWLTQSGNTTALSLLNRGFSSDLAYAYAVSRSHPLPSVEWLEGPPDLGEPADNVHATDSLNPQTQWFRSLLPAGVTTIQLPDAGKPATAWVAGAEVSITDGTCRLDQPLPEPAELLIRTTPTAIDRGGAWWTGPLRLITAPAPIRLADWGTIGLAAWSGGVRYRSTVQVPSDARDLLLDLGRLRGTVEVTANGRPAGTAFCAPFRFQLGDLSGSIDVEVTVYNTLAPFLNESTPTTWVFPSQLVSGLLGPVSLSYRTKPSQADWS